VDDEEPLVRLVTETPFADAAAAEGEDAIYERVRSTMDLHGGAAWVRSSPGERTVLGLRFRLPDSTKPKGTSVAPVRPPRGAMSPGRKRSLM
jgi:hypothetical protein